MASLFSAERTIANLLKEWLQENPVRKAHTQYSVMADGQEITLTEGSVSVTKTVFSVRLINALNPLDLLEKELQQMIRDLEFQIKKEVANGTS